MAGEFEACSSVHLPHDPLRLGVGALGPAVVVRQSQGHLNGGLVEAETAGEGVGVGKTGAADRGGPLVEQARSGRY